MRKNLFIGIAAGIIRFVANVLFFMVSWIKKNAKTVIMFGTFFTAICLMSGIDNQMWQAVPALLLLGLLNVEMAIWEDE